ncbi:MAG TPA: hypothetical protein VGJ96_01335 [Gemmatimonadaceae bacterium]|jgi:hypothetical protein
MTSPRTPIQLAAALCVLVGAPAVLRAQVPTPPTVTPPAPAASTAPKVRRTVEIRAQAPAPEVITVRPREVPQYTRRLLVPALLTPAETTGAVRASVVVPAPASDAARAAAAPDRRTRTP